MITEMTRLYYPDNASSLLPPEDCDLNENRSWILDTLLLEDCSDVTLNDFARGMGVSPVRQKELSKIITVHLSESCAMNQRWLWRHRSLRAKTLL